MSADLADPAGPVPTPRWGRRVVLVLGMMLAGRLVAGAVWQSIWTVESDEQAVITRFGRVDRVVGAGMQLSLPWPFETVTKVKTELVRPMPVGWTYYRDAVGLPPTEEESQWLTGDTNIVEIKATVEYKIEDPVKYLFHSGGSEGAKGMLVRRLTEAEFTRRVGARGVDTVLSGGTGALQGEVYEVLQEAFDELQTGFKVVAVHIGAISPPLDVKQSFEDVSTAKANYGQALNDADGYARGVLSKSQSQAYEIRRDAEVAMVQRVQEANGAVARFRGLAAEVRQAPLLSRRRMWLEAVQGLLEKVELFEYAPEEGTTTRIVRTRNARSGK